MFLGALLTITYGFHVSAVSLCRRLRYPEDWRLKVMKACSPHPEVKSRSWENVRKWGSAACVCSSWTVHDWWLYGAWHEVAGFAVHDIAQKAAGRLYRSSLVAYKASCWRLPWRCKLV